MASSSYTVLVVFKFSQNKDSSGSSSLFMKDFKVRFIGTFDITGLYSRVCTWEEKR